MFTGKADIWSAFLTIMHVLLGKNENEMALDKVKTWVYCFCQETCLHLAYTQSTLLKGNH